ncbi:hypothetical protein RRG08_057613 [Elysia crispata]|uniref:Uncharacterized protein n=1 Tax=Elysia crispata TaxID=231223 RepID=A0AAE1ANT6_9GAST|nr:hypothetical protein RRG08_057613 [Elysia crispata]
MLTEFSDASGGDGTRRANLTVREPEWQPSYHRDTQTDRQSMCCIIYQCPCRNRKFLELGHVRCTGAASSAVYLDVGGGVWVNSSEIGSRPGDLCSPLRGLGSVWLMTSRAIQELEISLPQPRSMLKSFRTILQQASLHGDHKRYRSDNKYTARS